MASNVRPIRGLAVGQAPLLAPKEPRASFFLCATCGACGSPIFVHETYDDADVPTAMFATCQHEIDDGMAKYPRGEHVAAERQSIRLLWSMFHQLQQALVVLTSAEPTGASGPVGHLPTATSQPAEDQAEGEGDGPRD